MMFYLSIIIVSLSIAHILDDDLYGWLLFGVLLFIGWVVKRITKHKKD